MFGENGFCDDGPHTARANHTQYRCDQMNYEDKQMTHEQSYQSLKAGILDQFGIRHPHLHKIEYWRRTAVTQQRQD
jgi:hypothetical protein